MCIIGLETHATENLQYKISMLYGLLNFYIPLSEKILYSTCRTTVMNFPLVPCMLNFRIVANKNFARCADNAFRAVRSTDILNIVLRQNQF